MYTSPILLLLVSIFGLLRRMVFCEECGHVINIIKTTGLDELKGSSEP